MFLPPGVVDGGPAQDDAHAGVGAVQVEHGQSLLVGGPSNEENDNVLRPGIKAQIMEWFGLKGSKSSSRSQQTRWIQALSNLALDTWDGAATNIDIGYISNYMLYIMDI